MDFFSISSSWMYGKRAVRVLLLGLDCAGKTTILYGLYNDRFVEDVAHTVAFNFETVVVNFKFQMWDLGGQNQLRQFWQLNYVTTQGIVLVIDSADRERIETCTSELKVLFAEEALHGVPLCVVENNQDLSDVMSVAELRAQHALSDYNSRTRTILPASATQGTGSKEAFDWLAETMESRQR
jgi:small GTP-binding protein